MQARNNSRDSEAEAEATQNQKNVKKSVGEPVNRNNS